MCLILVIDDKLISLPGFAQISSRGALVGWHFYHLPAPKPTCSSFCPFPLERKARTVSSAGGMAQNPHLCLTTSPPVKIRARPTVGSGVSSVGDLAVGCCLLSASHELPGDNFIICPGVLSGFFLRSRSCTVWEFSFLFEIARTVLYGSSSALFSYSAKSDDCLYLK